MFVFIVLGITTAWYSCSLLVQTSIICSFLIKAKTQKNKNLFLLSYGLGSFCALFLTGILLAFTASSISILRIKIIPFLETINGPVLILIGAYFLGWLRNSRVHNLTELKDKNFNYRTLFFLGISLSFTLCSTAVLIYMTQVIPQAITRNNTILGPFLYSLSYVISTLLLGYLFHVFGESLIYRKSYLNNVSKLIGYSLIAIGVYLSFQLNLKLINQW